jgi:hypothetical protein
MFNVLAETVPTNISEFITDPPIALLITFLVLAILAVASGKVVVPRPFYDRETARADKATEQVTELTKVVGEYNDELRELRRGSTS